MEAKDKLKLFRDSCKSSMSQGLQELDELIEKKDYINAEIRLDYLNGLIQKTDDATAGLLESAQDQNSVLAEIEEEKRISQIKVNFQGSWEILN